MPIRQLLQEFEDRVKHTLDTCDFVEAILDMYIAYASRNELKILLEEICSRNNWVITSKDWKADFDYCLRVKIYTKEGWDKQKEKDIWLQILKK